MPVADEKAVAEILKRFSYSLVGWHLKPRDAENILSEVTKLIKLSTEITDKL